MATGSASITSATRMCSIRPANAAWISAERAALARKKPTNASQIPVI
jgi:hypothetical protein